MRGWPLADSVGFSTHRSEGQLQRTSHHRVESTSTLAVQLSSTWKPILSSLFLLESGFQPAGMQVDVGANVMETRNDRTQPDFT